MLRTGSSAIRSAAVLIDEVVGPAMAASGLDPAAIQLLRVPGREAAVALVRQPRLIPLVILRGSGDSTRALAHEAALHGVRTLAHADGGAVIYIDQSADTGPGAAAHRAQPGPARRLQPAEPAARAARDLGRDGARRSRRWRTSSASRSRCRRTRIRSATSGRWTPARRRRSRCAAAQHAADAAEIANRETSGLAASIVAADADAAAQFLDTYAGTGAFWNATPRLLDGFKLLSVPETGINIDVVPGPRGPVTFRDLYLRQYVVVPAGMR